MENAIFDRWIGRNAITSTLFTFQWVFSFNKKKKRSKIASLLPIWLEIFNAFSCIFVCVCVALRFNKIGNYLQTICIHRWLFSLLWMDFQTAHLKIIKVVVARSFLFLFFSQKARSRFSIASMVGYFLTVHLFSNMNLLPIGLFYPYLSLFNVQIHWVLEARQQQQQQKTNTHTQQSP